MSFSFGVATPTPAAPASTGFTFGSIDRSPTTPQARPASPNFSFGTSKPKEAAPSTPTPTKPTPTTTKSKSTKSSPAVPSPPNTRGETSLGDGIEGLVAFPSRGDAQYRFELVATGGTLYIWLEDRKTKKQWRTDQLALKDFVHDDRVIPMATFEDYAKCFVNCLQASTWAESDFSRDLVPAADAVDAWELQLTLKIRVFATTWTPTYSFVLHPVPLEPVDLLAAKIRDQEEHIKDLKHEVKTLTEKLEDPRSTAQPLVYVRGTLVNAHTTGKLVWKPDGLALTGKAVFHSSGAIRFTTGGTFVVNALVQNTNSNNNTTLELHVNGKIVVSCIDSNANGHHHISPIYHVLTAAPNDELVMVYRGNNTAYAGSYMVIHELR